MSEVKCNYLSKTKLIDELVNRVESQIKIRKGTDEIRDIVEGIMMYFDYFNSMDEYCKFAFNNKISIDDILIPAELSDFIIPASVKRIAGSRICVELLVRAEFDEARLKDEKPLNINSYDNLVSKFRSLFKKDSSDNMVKLSEIKLEISLESIINRICYCGRVRDLGEWYVPIQVLTSNDFNSSYFNNEYDEVLFNYLAYLKLN